MAKSKTERDTFPSRKNVEAGLRVLRGEELDLVSPRDECHGRDAVGVTGLLRHQRTGRLEKPGRR